MLLEGVALVVLVTLGELLLDGVVLAGRFAVVGV